MLVTVAGTSVYLAQPVGADEIILPSTRLMVVPEATTTTRVMLAPSESVIASPVTVIERPRKSHFFSRSLHKLVNVVDMDDDLDDDEIILNGVKVEIDD